MSILSRIGRRSSPKAMKAHRPMAGLTPSVLRDLGYTETRVHTARPMSEWTYYGRF